MMFSYPGPHYQPSVMRGHSHHSHTFGNKFIADIQPTVVSHNNNNNNTSVSVKCDFDSSNSLLTTTSTMTAINSMGSSLQTTNQLNHNHHNIGLDFIFSNIIFPLKWALLYSTLEYLFLFLQSFLL